MPCGKDTHRNDARRNDAAPLDYVEHVPQVYAGWQSELGVTRINVTVCTVHLPNWILFGAPTSARPLLIVQFRSALCGFMESSRQLF